MNARQGLPLSPTAELAQNGDSGATEAEKETLSEDLNGLFPNEEGYSLFTEEDRLDVSGLLRYAAFVECSDIHLKANTPIKLRINGELRPILGVRHLNPDDVQTFWVHTRTDADYAMFVQKKTEHAYAYELYGVGRFRIIITTVMGGLSVVARRLVMTPPSFDDLDTNPVIRDLANLSNGLIIVSGITGSGKSTLMAAIIDSINKSRGLNIVSLEDPVEIVHKDDKANIIQRSLGTDVKSFTDGIRDAMRQDPDVILIGEIRDQETASAALRAAETGHLVISTLHSTNSITSISRLISTFPDEEMKGINDRISDILRAIITQKLVKVKDGSRKAVNEILLANHAVRKAIEESAPPTELRRILEEGADIGMQTFESHLGQLYLEGEISESVALAQSSDREKMRTILEEVDKQLKLIEEDKKLEAEARKQELIASAVLPKRPKQLFSQAIREEEESRGVLTRPSSAAPLIPKKASEVKITAGEFPVMPTRPRS